MHGTQLGEACARSKTIKGNQPMRGGKRVGAGRKPGVPNKVTRDIRVLAQVHSDKAIKELARLATQAESEAARVAAIKELLDRGYGKSKQPVEHDVGEGLEDWLDRLATGGGAGK